MKIKPNHFQSQNLVQLNQVKRGDELYTVRENRTRYFYPDEWMVFFDSLTDKQRPTFNTLINTGARINEVRNIKFSDIDYERNAVIIRVTKTRNKDGTPRVRLIPISSQFSKYCRKIQRELSLPVDGYLPVLSTPGANLAMKTKLQKAGIQDWQMFSIHNIRKTLEVWLLALDVDSMKLAKHFGHSASVASKFYISSSAFGFEDKNMMREIIGDLYDGK